jgi:hypothetical protein
VARHCDRCSPPLHGTNGSGRLLAEAFHRTEIASLRYDKRASGPHAVEHVKQLIGRVSMPSYLGGLVGVAGELAAQGRSRPSASRMSRGKSNPRR